MEELLSGIPTLGIIAAFFVIILISRAIRSVPQGERWTVERFGRYTRTLDPGLNFLIPIVDRVGNKINVMEQVLDVPSQEVITRDNAMVTVDGVVFFQILEPAQAAYEVRNLEHAILNLTMTNIRTVMGSMDLDALLSNRDTINSQLLTVVDQASNPWGVKATRIEIKDITPPKDLVDSMARQMKAERDKRASILTAEGQRQSAILKAEGEQQSRVLEATGEKDAAYLEAESRERLAQAEARAATMMSDALANGSQHAINYFVAQKYIEAFGKLAESPNQRTVFMPMEVSSLVSSIGGIGDLAKDIIGQGGAAPSQPPTTKPKSPTTTKMASYDPSSSPSTTTRTHTEGPWSPGTGSS